MPESTIHSRVQPLGILSQITYDQVVGMAGVLKTNWLKWIVADDIKDYAFVFDCMNIQSGLYANAHGMKNAFNTRFRVFSTHIDAHNVSLYRNCIHLPFSHLNIFSFVPQTGHHQTFQFLTQMKQNSDLVLWTKRKYNQASGSGRSTPIFVSVDCWTYFLARLKTNDGYGDCNFTPNSGARTLRCFFLGLNLKGKSTPYNHIFDYSKHKWTIWMSALNFWNQLRIWSKKGKRHKIKWYEKTISFRPN